MVIEVLTKHRMSAVGDTSDVGVKCRARYNVFDFLQVPDIPLPHFIKYIIITNVML